MGRTFRAVLVWIVVILMAVDPASACRYWRSACSPCYTSCYSSCEPVCCQPTAGYVVDDDGCDGSTSDVHRPAPPREMQREEMPTPAPAPQDDVRRRPTEPDMPKPSLPDEHPGEPTLAPEPAAPGEPTPAEPTTPEPSETQPEQPEPAPSVPAPTETPAENTAAPEPAEPATPAEPPKEPAAAPPAEEKNPAESDVDNLFDEEGGTSDAPVPTPAEPAAPPAEQPKAEPPKTETPKAEEKKPEAGSDDIDDLFNEPEETDKKAASGGEDQFRMWTDNTGTYHTRARILTVLDGKVRLLKDTGRTTTVPFRRLSQSDLAFVQAYTANGAKLAQSH